MTKLEELVNRCASDLNITVFKEDPSRLMGIIRTRNNFCGFTPRVLCENTIASRKLVEITVERPTRRDARICHYCFNTAVHLALNAISNKDNCYFRCPCFHPDYCYSDQLRPHPECKKGLHGYC